MHAAIQATAATDEQEFPIGLEDRAVGEIQYAYGAEEQGEF